MIKSFCQLAGSRKNLVRVLDMRALRIFLAFFCVWSVVDFVLAVHAILSPWHRSSSARHESLVMAASLVAALLYASALYGIHKRTFTVWKLGWGFLAVQYLGWLFQGLRMALQVPQADSPWAASAAVVIGGGAVALYWGFWWNRQRSYFVQPASHE
jgi:hypothetical protein